MGVQRPCDHVGARALYECRDDEAGQGFAGIRDIFSPQQDSTIKSCKGTVRGVKNRVRAGIATFTSDQRISKVSVLQLSCASPTRLRAVKGGRVWR